MSSQNDMILKALRRGPLGPIQALLQYGVYRLASRIYDLRSAGHSISTHMVESKDGKRHAMYTLDRK